MYSLRGVALCSASLFLPSFTLLIRKLEYYLFYLVDYLFLLLPITKRASIFVNTKL